MITKEVQSLIVILNFLQNNRATSNRTACCGQFSKRSDLQHTSGVVTVWALVWVYLTVWRWCVCLYALVAVFADLVECARICQITHSSTRPTANIPRVGFPGNNTTTCWSDLRYRTAVQKHKYTEDESAWETEERHWTPQSTWAHGPNLNTRPIQVSNQHLFCSYIQQYHTQRGGIS